MAGSNYTTRLNTRLANHAAADSKFSKYADPANQEELLKRQFAAARSRLGGQKSETERQSDLSLQRLQAVTGQTGGSIEAARQKSIQDIGRQFADVESGLSAQEAQAQQELGAQAEQSRQFERTLAEQSKQFEKSLGFQFQELEENKRTNLINAAIALRESGLKGAKDWQSLLGSQGQPGPLSAIFGGRAPNIPSPNRPTTNQPYRPVFGGQTVRQ